MVLSIFIIISSINECACVGDVGLQLECLPLFKRSSQPPTSAVIVVSTDFKALLAITNIPISNIVYTILQLKSMKFSV